MENRSQDYFLCFVFSFDICIILIHCYSALIEYMRICIYDAAITTFFTKSLSLIISPGDLHQVYSTVWVRKWENRKSL